VLIRQLGLIESPEPHSWDAYAGGVAWIKAAVQGRDFQLGDDKRPLRSLANPGQAYTDPVLGKDPQIAHYRELKPGMDVHATSGIGNKAFYEAAQRVGVQRAGQIWLETLPGLCKQTPITYRSWATCLLAASGPDRTQVSEALRVVGLDVDSEKSPAAQSRKPE